MVKVKLKKSENKVWIDSLVEDLHAFRASYAKFSYDLDAIFEDLKLYEKP